MDLLWCRLHSKDENRRNYTETETDPCRMGTVIMPAKPEYNAMRLDPTPMPCFISEPAPDPHKDGRTYITAASQRHPANLPTYHQALPLASPSRLGARGPTIQSCMANHWLHVCSAPSISAKWASCSGLRKGTVSCGDMS